MRSVLSFVLFIFCGDACAKAETFSNIFLDRKSNARVSLAQDGERRLTTNGRAMNVALSATGARLPGWCGRPGSSTASATSPPTRSWPTGVADTGVSSARRSYEATGSGTGGSSSRSIVAACTSLEPCRCMTSPPTSLSIRSFSRTFRKLCGQHGPCRQKGTSRKRSSRAPPLRN